MGFTRSRVVQEFFHSIRYFHDSLDTCSRRGQPAAVGGKLYGDILQLVGYVLEAVNRQFEFATCKQAAALTKESATPLPDL